MESSLWNISSLLFKLVIYFGFTNAVAIPAVMLLAKFDQVNINALKSKMIKFSMMALFASFGYFFIQVGIMSETGLSGMLNQFMIQLVWNASIGISTVYRILGLGLSVVVAIKFSKNKSNKLSFIYMLSLIFIGLSFCTSGHVSELSTLARFAIAIHVLIAFWWMGSFYPLLLSCHQLSLKSLSILMHKFGQIASFFVGVLIVAGTYLAVELVGSFDQLFTTSYGALLGLKLILVVHILVLAAFHKFIVVPSLIKNKQSRNSLVISIKVEMALGVAILITTGILTTLLGPGHHG